MDIRELTHTLQVLRDSWRELSPAHVDEALRAATAAAVAIEANLPDEQAAQPPALIKCPHCGNADLREMVWQEWIPSTREIGIYADGMLYVDASDYKDHGECGDGDELVCLKCVGAGSFPVPPGVGITHAEPDEIEARRAAGQVTQHGTFGPSEEADAI